MPVLNPTNSHRPARVFLTRRTRVTLLVSKDGKSSSPTTAGSSTNSNNNNNYNDDFFGFVFLGGIVGAQDFFFSGIFLLCSAVAAIVTRQGKLPAAHSIPAIVAGLTLLLTVAIREALPGPLAAMQSVTVARVQNSIGDDTAAAGSSANPNAAWIEIGLCSVSMAYGFGLHKAFKDEAL